MQNWFLHERDLQCWPKRKLSAPSHLTPPKSSPSTYIAPNLTPFSLSKHKLSDSHGNFPAILFPLFFLPFICSPRLCLFFFSISSSFSYRSRLWIPLKSAHTCCHIPPVRLSTQLDQIGLNYSTLDRVGPI